MFHPQTPTLNSIQNFPFSSIGVYHTPLRLKTNPEQRRLLTKNNKC